MCTSSGALDVEANACDCGLQVSVTLVCLLCVFVFRAQIRSVKTVCVCPSQMLFYEWSLFFLCVCGALIMLVPYDNFFRFLSPTNGERDGAR